MTGRFYRAQVALGDSAKLLSVLGSDSVDAVITDPPYAVNMDGGAGWDAAFPAREIWRQCFRALKPGGWALVFGAARTIPFIGFDLAAVGFDVRDMIHWVYRSGMGRSFDLGKKLPDDPRAAGRRATLRPAHEPILVCRKPLPAGVSLAEHFTATGRGTLMATTEDGRHMPNVLASGVPIAEYAPFRLREQTLPSLDYEKPNAAERGDNEHPTVKPLALMAHLVDIATLPDDLVVDPFMGSGTTAVASMWMGRRCFGCERSPEYFEIINRRIDAATVQLRNALAAKAAQT